MKSKKRGNNNILVAIMFIIIVILIGYILFFNKSIESSTFYIDYTNAQNNISYYLGVTHTEMFGVYDIENIITGYTDDNKEIKTIEDNKMQTIGVQDEYITKNDKNYYKLDETKVKQVLGYELPKYAGIDWYISSDGILKIKFTSSKPKWWNDSLNDLKV